MDEPPRTDPLAVFAAASLHAALLIVAFLLTLRLTGASTAFLGSIGTAAGLGVYALLWLLSWASLRQALRGLDLSGHLPVGDALARGFMWGGLAGGAFVAALAIAVAVVLGEPRILVPAAIAAAFAIVAGGVVGALFAALDLALAAIARRTTP